MKAAGFEAGRCGVQSKIPSLEHLLALKLHALRYGHVGRYGKDLIDVESLVGVNGLDLASEKMRQLFLNYGAIQIYEQIRRFIAGDHSGA